MERHYCGPCGRFMDTEVCILHGAGPEVPGNSKPVIADLRQAVPGMMAYGRGISIPSGGASGADPHTHPLLRPKPPIAKPSLTAARTGQVRRAPGTASESDILRFRKSERELHWAIAIPFMVCWLSALILVFIYNPLPTRPLRDLFSWVHRLSGLSLIVFPALVILRSRAEYRTHFYNIRCAWRWSLNDMKWLALMGLAAISRKIVLPEQGKFNAAEKVNFMTVMIACPVFIATGALIWLQQLSWIAWLIHGLLALLVSPTMLGHIYMATLNRGTKVGLTGMLSGYVNRKWARHHYAIWYRENFEKSPARKPAPPPAAPKIEPDHRVHVHCPSCTDNVVVPWGSLLKTVSTGASVSCPQCGVAFATVKVITVQQQLQFHGMRLGRGGPDAPARV